MEIIIDGSHSYNLVRIITERRIEKFAEIGVHRGKSSRTILRHCNKILKEYWGVDKYNTDWEGEKKRAHYPYMDEEKWHTLYKHACKYMPFFPQLRILRMKSREAVALFPKEYFPQGYFDFVYIDANHYFAHVKEDIELWLPLIKEGGLIGGHDYGSDRFPDVKKAVDEIFGVENVTWYKNQKIWLINC